MRWLTWLLGAALLVAVVVFFGSASEQREFARLVEEAAPRWFAAALALQAATYVAQAEVFRAAPRRAGVSLPRWWLCRLSLAKLFLDQALPSAGISSAVVVARALQTRGVPRGTVAAGVVNNIASYHIAFVVALLVALAVTAVRGETSALILVVSVTFVAFAVGFIVLLMTVSGRQSDFTKRLLQIRALQGMVGFLQDADVRLVRDRGLLREAAGWQLAIFMLDAATMWVLVLSLGSTAAPDAVFSSFMISSLFRTMGIVPGGLGIYEATSVLTLRMVGVGVPVALSATLIFRGLSFWLPMLPGLWFSRQLTASGNENPLH